MNKFFRFVKNNKQLVEERVISFTLYSQLLVDIQIVILNNENNSQ